MFVSSEFKWLWLVTGNRYLQCDGVGEVDVLDEVAGCFDCQGYGGENCVKCRNERRDGEIKIFKREVS